MQPRTPPPFPLRQAAPGVLARPAGDGLSFRGARARAAPRPVRFSLWAARVAARCITSRRGTGRTLRHSVRDPAPSARRRRAPRHPALRRALYVTRKAQRVLHDECTTRPRQCECEATGVDGSGAASRRWLVGSAAALRRCARSLSGRVVVAVVACWIIDAEAARYRPPRVTRVITRGKAAPPAAAALRRAATAAATTAPTASALVPWSPFPRSRSWYGTRSCRIFVVWRVTCHLKPNMRSSPVLFQDRVSRIQWHDWYTAAETVNWDEQASKLCIFLCFTLEIVRRRPRIVFKQI